MNKNILILALVCVLSVFALTGCGSESEEQKAKEEVQKEKGLSKEEIDRLGGGFEGMNFKPTPNKGY